MKHLIFILACLISVISVEAQQVIDSLNRKNIVKLDITSYWLYRNAIVFSYERVIKPNRSIAITLGYQEFPYSTDIGSRISVKDDNKKNGLKFGGEYRYYLIKENKFRGPHGVYMGPYFTYHRYLNDRTIEFDNNGTLEEAELSTKFSILNLGFQIGYQFVLNNRWTIDLVFIGPSFSNYRFKAKLDGADTFTTEDIKNEVILDLIDRFPMLGEVIDEKEANSKGSLDVWGYGYRYQFQVGYKFGRKQK